jgi:hypothetical protein
MGLEEGKMGLEIARYHISGNYNPADINTKHWGEEGKMGLEEGIMGLEESKMGLEESKMGLEEGKAK